MVLGAFPAITAVLSYHVEFVLGMIFDQLKLPRRRHVVIRRARLSASCLADLAAGGRIIGARTALAVTRPVQTVLLLGLLADQGVAFLW